MTDPAQPFIATTRYTVWLQHTGYLIALKSKAISGVLRRSGAGYTLIYPNGDQLTEISGPLVLVFERSADALENANNKASA